MKCFDLMFLIYTFDIHLIIKTMANYNNIGNKSIFSTATTVKLLVIVPVLVIVIALILKFA